MYVLRFFFDYNCGTCVWSNDEKTKKAFDYCIAPSSLPISRKLVKKIEALSAEFDTSLNTIYPPDPSPWKQKQCHLFNKKVQILFNELKKELGKEFILINEFVDFKEDPELLEYEKDPKNYKRK